MLKNIKTIPVNTMADMFGTGIAIGKATIKDLQIFEEAEQSHRDDYHIFFLLEKGNVSFEVDFQQYNVSQSCVIYIHPNQVHRMGAFENVIASFWAINNENLNSEYLKLLEEITPVKPLTLNKETLAVISEAVSLCLKFSERKNEKLYYSLLNGSCNTLIGLVISQYLVQSKPSDKLSRFEIVTKAFKQLLERNFITAKRPTEYAQQLNISSSYLNECVKNTTGHSVSHHIQQRIVLEAKRLLYHSDISVKEIATELGYDDYPYFSRLFTKVSGISAVAFRNKNHD